MAAPSEEKLICDKFNLEALTGNQVKGFKALADGKDVFIGTKTGSGKSLSYESIPVIFPGSIVIVIALVGVDNEGTVQ
jgi:superfamily II DNA helicase RecQ